MRGKKQNTDDTVLRIGEKVQIGVEEGGPAYPTLLEDILNDGRLIVSSPMYRGIPLPAYVDKEVHFYFYRENGRYRIFCKIDEIFMHNDLRLLSLQPLSKPVKQQRRETFRLPISLDARLRYFADVRQPAEEEPVKKDAEKENPEDDSLWETTITHNISETGVAIRSQLEYQLGDMVRIRMQIENGLSGEQLDLLGIVRQVEKVEDKRKIFYRLGIEFMPYEENKRRSMARFILKKQQIILKMKRNVDD